MTKKQHLMWIGGIFIFALTTTLPAAIFKSDGYFVEHLISGTVMGFISPFILASWMAALMVGIFVYARQQKNIVLFYHIWIFLILITQINFFIKL